MAEKKKAYVITGGKHYTKDKDGNEVILVKGDTIRLTDKEAVSLAGKIALDPRGAVETEDPAEDPLKAKEVEGAGKENTAQSSIPAAGSAQATTKPVTK